MIGPGSDPWGRSLPDNPIINSPFEILEREGMRVEKNIHITGNNDSYNINVFQVFGTVDIISQYAEITEVNNLTNMIGVYADLWDGVVSDDLTADGATLSNFPIGSWFTKDRETTETYSVINASTCKKHEIRPAEDIGLPFQVTQKTGNVDTFIRFNYTTNTVLDFWMKIFFRWRPLNGGRLVLLQ